MFCVLSRCQCGSEQFWGCCWTAVLLLGIISLLLQVCSPTSESYIANYQLLDGSSGRARGGGTATMVTWLSCVCLAGYAMDIGVGCHHLPRRPVQEERATDLKHDAIETYIDSNRVTTYSKNRAALLQVVLTTRRTFPNRTNARHY